MSEEEIMYLEIVSWLFAVTIVTGIIGMVVGIGLAAINDYHDRQPRLWPQIVCEIGGVMLSVGMIVFGTVVLAASDDKILSIIDVILALASIAVGIVCLVFMALGLMRYEYEVRLISYRLIHLSVESDDDDDDDDEMEFEEVFLNEDIYFSNN